jgi:hypothetical protein
MQERPELEHIKPAAMLKQRLRSEGPAPLFMPDNKSRHLPEDNQAVAMSRSLTAGAGYSIAPNTSSSDTVAKLVA